jgi:hypothetical protein
MATVQKDCDIIVVGSERPDVVRDVHMIPAETMEEAFRVIEDDLGNDLEVIIVPQALLTLPIVENPLGKVT